MQVLILFNNCENNLGQYITFSDDGNGEGNEMCDCVTWPVFFICTIYKDISGT